MAPTIIHAAAIQKVAEFLTLIETQADALWHVAQVNAAYLSTRDQRALANALSSLFETTEQSYIFFLDDGDIFAVWRGFANPLKDRLTAWATNNCSNKRALPTKAIVTFPDRNFIKSAAALNMPEAVNEPSLDTLLPLHPEALSHYEAKAKSSVHRSRPVALIVEDVEFSRKLLETILQDRFDVAGAADAHQAWSLFVGLAPDIVFLDIELPVISGHHLTARIREIHPSVFMAVVSGRKTITDINRAKQNRANAFIVKPYNRQKIEDCIAQFRLLHPHFRTRSR